MLKELSRSIWGWATAAVAESAAEEGDVLALFDCGLGGVGLDGRAGEGNLGEAGFGDDCALVPVPVMATWGGELVDGDAV